MSQSKHSPVLEGAKVPSDRITPADLRTKFGELQGDVRATAQTATSKAINIGVVVAAVIVLSVFTMGVRRGRRGTTVVEIRRV